MGPVQLGACHGLVVGQTGTGKSYLSEVLLRPAPAVVVIDPKYEWETGRADAWIAHRPRQLNRNRKPYIIYRPAPEYCAPSDYERVFEWIYHRRNTRVYIDELGSLGTNHANYPYWLQMCYQQGRSLGIHILGSSQRPANLPGFVTSESKQFWKFYLLKLADQERMAEVMGDQVIDHLDGRDDRHREDHSFWYKDLSMRVPRLCVVVDEERRAA